VLEVNPRHLESTYRSTNQILEPQQLKRMPLVRRYAESGEPMSPPEVVAEDGYLRFGEGRHRTRLAIEMGLDSIPVAIRAGDESEFLRLLREHGKVYQ
jgi:hypothetical protein